MAGRRLNPEERALWMRVAAGVRPIKIVAVEAVEPSVDTATKRVAMGNDDHRRVQHDRSSAVKRVVTTSAPANANTLDGSWDRRLSNGRITPERTIDLHGYTLASAHRHLDTGLGAAVADGVRTVLLVTGKAPARGASRLDTPLRGVIRASIGDWLAASRHAPQIAAIRPAHPRHGGAGALYLILRRSRF